MRRPRNWMDFANPITQKRRDVRHQLDRVHELEAELSRLAPGPGYYEAKQRLTAQIETARQVFQRNQQELIQMQTGVQTALL